ncbi:MAG: HNH endonuclease [bacterium]|nr:HNH endonuclease [bacterium]
MPLKSKNIVHHKDKNRENNNLDNLEVLPRSLHTKLHRLQKL